MNISECVVEGYFYNKYLFVNHDQYYIFANTTLSEKWTSLNKTLTFYINYRQIYDENLETVVYVVKKFAVPFRVLNGLTRSLPGDTVINAHSYSQITENGEMRRNLVTPIVFEDYVATMLAPIVPMPNAGGNLLATLSYQTWLLLVAATLFVSTVSIRNKNRWHLNLGCGVEAVSYYETGFYNYGIQLYILGYRSNASPILRKLYREGLIDDDEVKPLTLAALQQSFTVALYSFPIAVIVLAFEVLDAWLKT